MSEQKPLSESCTHELTEVTAFAPVPEGFYAIYVDPPDQAQPTLRNVVGWVTLRCSCGQVARPVAYVPIPYSDQLVRASSLPDFVSLVGPNPQSDHKAGAARIVSEANAHRSAQLAQEARQRRATSDRWGTRRVRRRVPK